MQERGRGQVGQAGVAAAPVIEHGDVLEQIARRLVSSRIACAMNPLILEAVEEALGRGVDAPMSSGAH